MSGDDDLFVENDNQENQSSSNENSEGEVSLASHETNQNGSNENSCKISQPGGKTANGKKKRNSEKKSYETDTEKE